MTPRRGRDTDEDVITETARLHREGLTETGRPFGATQIERALSLDSRFEGRVPSIRTIRRILDELPADDSAPWGLLSATAPEEVALVLPVLAYVARTTQWAVTALTQREATLILRITRAAPELPAPAVWGLTQRYIREEREALLHYYNLFLALAPWRSADRREEFETAVKRGVQWSKLSHRDEVLLLSILDVASQKEETDGTGTHQKAGQQVERRARRGPRRGREA